MSINLGDGVLTFIGDTTQLEQAYANIEAGSAASMAPAAAQVEQLGTAFTATGAQAGAAAVRLDETAAAERSAASAAEELNVRLATTAEESSVVGEAMTAMSEKLAGLLGILALAEGFKVMTEGVQKSVLELGHLSEKTGINITQLAGLKAVSEQNGISFDSVGTALVRLERAQGAAVTSAGKQRDAFAAIGISVEELKTLSPEELFFRTAEGMANTTNHATLAQAATALLGRGFQQILPILLENNAELREQVHQAGLLSGVTEEARKAAADWEMTTAKLSQQIHAGLIPAMELALPLIKSVETAGTYTWGVMKELGIVLGQLFIAQVETAKTSSVLLKDILTGNLIGFVADTKVASQEAQDHWTSMTKMMGAQFKDTVDSINNLVKESNPARALDESTTDLVEKIKNAAKEADRLAKEQAKSRDKQIAEEDAAWMKSRQLAITGLQEAEKQKVDATVQGSRARLAAIEAAIKEEESKGLQDTAYYRSLQDQKVRFLEAAEAQKERILNADATRALKVAADNAKNETAAVTQQYSEQAKAVELLGKFKILSAQQVSRRLEQLYQEESNAVLKIENDLLKKEEEAAKAAQSKLTGAQNNPFMSPQQLEQLKSVLAQAEKAVEASHAKILKSTQDFENKQLALDKGRYGQALAAATAFGNALLAEKLKENRATLLTAQAELIEAKARGVNTAAIEKEIATLKKNENELIKDAQRMKGATDSVNHFRDAMKSAYSEEAGAFATATEAMITGQESFGKAMEAATFKMLGNIAKHYADVYIAKGLGNLADQNYALATEDFVAAAAFEAIGGALSGLGANAGKAGSGKAGSASGGTSIGPAGTSAPQPVSTINIQRLGTGGLVTEPTLALLGDNPNGGRQREAVIPLGDPETIKAIAQAFGIGSSGQNVTHNWYIKGGVMSADSLAQMTSMISRQVQTGRVRLLSSNASKLTRRA